MQQVFLRVVLPNALIYQCFDMYKKFPPLYYVCELSEARWEHNHRLCLYGFIKKIIFSSYSSYGMVYNIII